MESSQEKIEERKKKLKSWLENKYNLALIGVMLLAFFIRMYYFFVTKNQTLWWDGLSYAALAKTNFLYGIPWEQKSIVIFFELLIRPPLFPLLWMILMKFSFTELMSKFVLEIIPSVLSIFIVYLIGKEVYDKRTGLIAAFVFSVSWMHIFYSMRMLTHAPSLLFSLLSILYFFKSELGDKTKYFALSIFFLSIATLSRYPDGILGIVYLFMMFSTDKFNFLKKKSFWKGGLIGFSPIILFFVINFIIFGHIFPAILTYIATSEEKTVYAFYTLGFIKHILKNPFYLVFIFGILLTAVQLFLSYGMISKSKKLKFHLFNIMLLAANLAFHIFLIKASEDRYLFLNYSAFLFPIALGVEYIWDFVRKYDKIIAGLIVLTILTSGAYSNLKFGDTLIEDRKESFAEMKRAFLWIRNNTPKEAVILGEGVDFYTVYYAERTPKSWPVKRIYADIYSDIIPQEWIDLEDNLEGYEVEADYIVTDVFHGNPQHALEWIVQNQDKLEPVYAEFSDAQQQQPTVIVFKYIVNQLSSMQN